MQSNLWWASFLRHAARRSSAGSIRPFDGGEAAWVHSSLIINNGAYLTAPASSGADLRTRLAAAAADAHPRQAALGLLLVQPYVASLAAGQVTAIASEFGLARMLGMQVMTAEADALKPAVRSLQDLDFRRIASRQESWIAFDINLRSYGMPVSMADSVLDTNAYFSDPLSEFGFIAFAGGAPVSTATVIELDGCLYVALVATDPEHRQKGYAEAVMRHALSVAGSTRGLSRTALDASVMGAPLYLSMGYQRTGEAWSMYAPA